MATKSDQVVKDYICHTAVCISLCFVAYFITFIRGDLFMLLFSVTAKLFLYMNKNSFFRVVAPYDNTNYANTNIIKLCLRFINWYYIDKILIITIIFI